jgi:glycosyltransferase involved in cell wall biosynthesis
MTKTLFVDAGSLAEKNMSGVGHTAYNLILALATDKDFCREYKLTLIVPFNKVSVVRSHKLPANVAIRRLFIPGKIMNGLVRFGLVPYMDIFFGKGVYLFPNFKNWPLLLSRNITYVHDVYFKVAPEHIESRNLDLLERHLSLFIRRADLVVTVSRHAKSEIEHFFPESRDKVVVVHNGLDHALYYPRDKQEQESVATKYGVKTKDFFLFFSNIEPRKNVSALLDAYQIFIDQQKNKDVTLLLVGGMGWGNEAILSKMKQLQEKGYKVVKPNRYVPDSDMPALLSGAICLVHPAVYEGFGLTPLEAMACGTPVIVGNNSSLPEVMGENYDRYVDITNPQAMAQEMVYYYQRPAINKKGLQRAQHFTWSKSASDLFDAIKRLDIS